MKETEGDATAPQTQRNSWQRDPLPLVGLFLPPSVKWGRAACPPEGVRPQVQGAGTGRWASACSVTSAKVTCGARGEPHSHRSPGISAQAGLALPRGAPQGRQGPPGWQEPPQEHRHGRWTHTRASLRASLPRIPPSQSTSATTGAAPPLKGADRLPESTRPLARLWPLSAPRGQSPSSGRSPGPAPLGPPKAKAWQGPGRGSGGGGSP